MAERERGDRGDDRRERHHERGLGERLEIIKRAPLDDAREVLITLLSSAFLEGVRVGSEEEARRMERVLCCCRRRRDDDDDDEWDDRDDRRRRRDRD